MTTLSPSTYRCLLATSEDERQPMSEDIARMFITLSLMERSVGVPDDLAEKCKQDFCYKIMEQRLESVGMLDKVSNPCLVFLSCLSECVPGNAVMWAYTAVKIAEEHGKCDLHTLALNFPMGFPVEKAQERVWDEQKESGAPLGNWIDKMDWVTPENETDQI